MPYFNRTFNADRKAQGFKSSAHLDAFFVHYDHVTNCADCHALDGDTILDDGRQPTAGECPTAQALYRAYVRVS